MDQKKGAVNTFDGDTLTSKQFKKWKKKPSRFDIYGVDTLLEVVIMLK